MQQRMLPIASATVAFLFTAALAQQPAVQPPVRPRNNLIPDNFTNLQVLPKDITKPELVKVMKQFSITFDVRCRYCHAVSDDLTEGSFSSDEKETKLKARELLRSIYSLRDQRMKPTSSGSEPFGFVHNESFSVMSKR